MYLPHEIYSGWIIVGTTHQFSNIRESSCISFSSLGIFIISDYIDESRSLSVHEIAFCIQLGLTRVYIYIFV